MNESLLRRLMNNRKSQHRWIALVLCLSMVVSLGTFASLHKTAEAQTYTKEVLDCPYAHDGASPVAHVHNDDCYDADRNLVCTLPEIAPHTHTEDCYTESRILICGLEDNPGHQHDDSCYQEYSVLDCGLEESDGHRHSDSCYTLERGELICENTDEDHVHDDSCYAWNSVLSCGMEVGEGAHHHSDACYRTERELACGLAEGEGAHTHSDACYETTRVLTCGQEELPVHVHDANCIKTVELTKEEVEDKNAPAETQKPEATKKPEEEKDELPEMPVGDPGADLETAQDWERDFDDIQLTGDWAKDLVFIAATQQGKGESSRNFAAVLNDEGTGWLKNGWTRFGAWYGIPYGEWSAMFVSFCLHYAGIPTENVPYNHDPELLAQSFKNGNLFAGRDYIPAPGDLIFFDTDDTDNRDIDHMGIVYYVDEASGTLNTVEGDRSDAVETFGYSLNDDEIVGYGMLPGNPYAPAEEEQPENPFIVMGEDENNENQENNDENTDANGQEAENAENGENTAPALPMPAVSLDGEAGGIQVVVEAPEGAFPEGVWMQVTPVNGNNLLGAVSAAVGGEVLEVQAVDIKFYDADTNELEPLVPIRVTMTAARRANHNEAMQVVHVDGNSVEVIEQAQDAEPESAKDVVFDADSFSIYGIVFTVDFEYEVDGKIYGYSMPGAQDIVLSDVLKALGIVYHVDEVQAKTSEDDFQRFMSSIASVTSTDESVVRVDQETWTIRVLKDGDAGIVVTMKDGARFEIKVKAEGETEVAGENVAISTVGDLYLPEGAEAKAEVVDGTEAVAAVKEEVEEKKDAETFYQVFDISLDNVNPEQYNGFKVNVQLPENVEGKEFHLYHIHDGLVEELKVNTVGQMVEGENKQVSSIQFVTPSFSQFVLSYTVDFEYSLNGKVFFFSLQGDDSITLSQLVMNMGLVSDEKDAANFVSKVENVTFTDESLLRVTKTENDWLLESLAPFTSTEMLTIYMKDGQVFEIKVTDAQDIRNLLESIAFTVNGTTYTGGETGVKIRQGDRFDLTLNFQEISGGQQFSPEMVYDLPDGLDADGFEADFTLDFDGALIEGNTVKIENGKIYITLNKNSENYGLVEQSGSSVININLNGIYNGNGGDLSFSSEINVNVEVDTSHNTAVEKSAWYDNNDHKIHYKITANSTGVSENVVITDTMTGTGGIVSLDTDSITVTSNKTLDSGTTTTSSAGGFTTTIPTMTNGETVTIEYTASIDTSKAGKDGVISVDETGNNVSIKAKDDDGSSTSGKVDNTIDISSFDKYASGVQYDSNGAPDTMKWQIIANKECLLSLKGSTIKDTIKENSRSYMSYTEGVIIYVYDAEGTLVDTRDLKWGEGGLTKSADGSSWTYTVPSDDGNYKYIIDYYTKLNVDGIIDDVKLENDADLDNGDHGTGHAEQSVGPKDEEKFKIKKEATNVTENAITWKISINVPSAGYSSLVVEDIFPNKWKGDRKLIDALVANSIVINDPDGNTYNVTTEEVRDDNGNVAGVKINFPGGVPASKSGSHRILEVSLSTNVNAEWLAMTQTDDFQNWLQHQNSVNVTANGTTKSTTAEAYIGKEHVKKETWNRAITMNDGTIRRLYQFTLYVTGVSDAVLTGDKLVLSDYFDTSVLEYLDITKTSDSVIYWQGMVSPGKNTGYYPGDITNCNVIETSELSDGSKTGLNLSIDKAYLTDEEGNYYPIYKIQYYLVSKDKLAEEAVKQSDGKVELSNTVDYGNESTVDFEYEYPGLTKAMANYNDATRTATFQLVVNPDKATMNGGNPMYLVDAYLTTMSIDYESIKVVTDPAGAEVTYDVTGTPPEGYTVEVPSDAQDQGGMYYMVFNVPDATAVTVTYSAKINRTGHVKLFNQANLNGGYKKTVEDWKDINGSASGGGSIVKMRVLKYEGGHMENSLQGVVFGLYTAAGYDTDGNPTGYTAITNKNDEAITFTTGSDGIATIVLNESTDGKELVKNLRYYIKEEVTPAGYQPLDPEYYSFMISDTPNYSQYIYMNNETLNIKNWPVGGLKITKSVVDAELSDEQKEKISFTVKKIEDSAEVDLYKVVSGTSESILTAKEIEEYEKGHTIDSKIALGSISYKDFSNGVYLVSGVGTGVYVVYESCQDIEGYTLSSTTYRVDTGSTTSYTESSKPTAEVTQNDIDKNNLHTFAFTNTYTSAKITLIKVDENNERLAGATFTLTKYKDSDYTTEDTSFEARTLIFDEDNIETGISVPGLTDGYYKVVETASPDGYIILDEEILFSVTTDAVTGEPTLTYTTPSEARYDYVAYTKTATSNVFLIKNEKEPEFTNIEVEKKWVTTSGEDVTDETDGEISVTVMQNKYENPVMIHNDISAANSTGKIERTFVVPGNSTVSYTLTIDQGEYYFNPELSFQNAAGEEIEVTYEETTNTTTHEKTRVYTFAVTDEDVYVTGYFNAELKTINELSAKSDVAPAAVVEYSTVKISSENGWKASLENLPMNGIETDSNGRHAYGYTYYLVEADLTPSSEKNNTNATGGTITLTNVKTKLTVKKNWNDNEGKTIESQSDVTFNLYQYPSDSEDGIDTSKYVDVDVKLWGYTADADSSLLYENREYVAKGSDVIVTVIGSQNGLTYKTYAIDGSYYGSSGGTAATKTLLNDGNYNAKYVFTINNVQSDMTIGALLQSSRIPKNVVVDIEWQTNRIDLGSYTIKKGEESIDIEGLPVTGTIDGKDVYFFYRVVEANLDGYLTTYDNNGGIQEGNIVITNQQENPKTQISVNKKWFIGEEEDTSMASVDGSISFELYRYETLADESFVPGTVSSDSSIKLNWGEEKKKEGSEMTSWKQGKNIIITVSDNGHPSEIIPELRLQTSTGGDKKASIEYSSKSTIDGNTVYTFVVPITAAMVGDNSFALTSSRYIDWQWTETIEYSEESIGTKIGDTYTITKNDVTDEYGAWSTILAGLDKSGVNSDGQPVNYTYSVVETSVNVAGAYSASYENNVIDSGLITIKNTEVEEETTSLIVNKKWFYNDGTTSTEITDKKGSITFKLLQVDLSASDDAIVVDNPGAIATIYIYDGYDSTNLKDTISTYSDGTSIKTGEKVILSGLGWSGNFDQGSGCVSTGFAEISGQGSNQLSFIVTNNIVKIYCQRNNSPSNISKDSSYEYTPPTGGDGIQYNATTRMEDASKTYTLNADDGWTYTFTKLPVVNGDGHPVSYTAEEVDIPAGYTSEVSEVVNNAVTITNTTTTTKKVDIEIQKVWKDSDDEAITQTSSQWRYLPELTLKVLKVDGTTKTDTGKTVTLNQENNFKAALTELDDGVYTVEEPGVEGYTLQSITDSSSGTVAVTNKKADSISLIVQKRFMYNSNDQWYGDYGTGNSDIKSINYVLLKKVTSSDGAIQLIDDIAADGTITYGYYVKVEVDGQTVFTLTPTSLATITLDEDDVTAGVTTKAGESVTINWAHEFTGLPGTKADYRFEECNSNGSIVYDSKVDTSRYMTCDEYGGQVTAIKNDLVDVRGYKNWEDPDDGNTYYHPELTFKLYRLTVETNAEAAQENAAIPKTEAEAIQMGYMDMSSEKTIAEGSVTTKDDKNNITGPYVEWTKLPKMDIATGKYYRYVVIETTSVEGYTQGNTTQVGKWNDADYIINNKPDSMSIWVHKEWYQNGVDITNSKTDTQITYELWRQGYTSSDFTGTAVVDEKVTKPDGVKGYLPIATTDGEGNTNYAWQDEPYTNLPLIGMKQLDGNSETKTKVYYKYYVKETSTGSYSTEYFVQDKETETKSSTPSAAGVTGSGNKGLYIRNTIAVNIDIIKVDATNMKTPLSGAQFTVKKLDPDGYGTYLSTDPVAVSSDTDDYGNVTISGITDGYYEVKETKVPAGYVIVDGGTFYFKVEEGVVSRIEKDESKSAKNWTVATDNTGKIRFTAADVNQGTNATFTVGNTPGTQLPNSGGIGTTLFTALGAALASTAGAALTMKKRKESE